MAFYRSIRSRRGRKKLGGGFELQLTSMMDVLVIIVVFLLKSYAASMNTFSTVPGLEMPISKSQDEPYDSLQVIITPEAITYDNQRIVEFQQTSASIGSNDAKYEFKATDLDEGNHRIKSLYEVLVKTRDQGEYLRARSTARDKDGKPLPFDGILAIQADKRVNYDTIRKVMYTAASAGFKTFRLLAIKRDG